MESTRKIKKLCTPNSVQPYIKTPSKSIRQNELQTFSKFLNSSKFAQDMLSVGSMLKELNSKYQQNFEITQNDIKIIQLALLTNEQMVNRLYHNFYLVSNSQKRFNCEYGKHRIVKVIIMIISLVFNSNFSSGMISEFAEASINATYIQNILEQLISKFYEEKKITLNDCELFIQLIYRINDNKQSKSENVARIVDKGIIFTLSLVLSICESSEEDSINQFIENYISFLEEKIKQNINLEYNLLTKEDLLKLITLTKLKRVNETTKKTIINFLTNLFKFNMKQMPISFLIKQLRHLIVQINNKEIDNYATNINFLTNIITFLQELVEKEKTTIQNDPYYVDKGFILNGRAPGGFQVNVIPELNKEFTMIFSFCCFSIDPSVEETPIFKFTNSKNEKLFYLYINKKRELCFDFQKTIYNVVEQNIQLNKSYLIIFTQCEISETFFFAKKTKLMTYINGEKRTAKFTFEEKSDFNINIGFNDNRTKYNTFIGKIGTFLIYNKVHLNEEQAIEITKKLKNKYYLIEELTPDISTNEYYNFYSSKHTNEIINFIQNNESIKTFNDKLHAVISHRVVYNVSSFYNKLKLTDNINSFKDYQLQYDFNCRPSTKSNCFPFKNFETVQHFYTYDGVSYLTLCVEYLYNIIDKMQNLDLIKEM